MFPTKELFLLLTENPEEKGIDKRVYVGYELTIKGTGVKNENENKASPNGKDISRVAMEKVNIISYTVSSNEKAIQPLVVLEKYIKNVNFLAYSGMLIQLFMIDELDIQRGMEGFFRISQIEWSIGDIRSKVIDLERHEVFDNYLTLVSFRQEIRKVLQYAGACLHLQAGVVFFSIPWFFQPKEVHPLGKILWSFFDEWR